MSQSAEPNRIVGSKPLRTNHGCQDATGDCGIFRGLSARRGARGLLTHAAACATCRDKLTETWRQLGRIPTAEFEAVLAGYKDGLSHRPRNIPPPRCATCHFPGQSCSSICRSTVQLPISTHSASHDFNACWGGSLRLRSGISRPKEMFCALLSPGNSSQFCTANRGRKAKKMTRPLGKPIRSPNRVITSSIRPFDLTRPASHGPCLRQCQRPPHKR